MECLDFDMNAYQLHVVKTNKFKTITVSVNFRRKIKKEEITIRNLLKQVMINCSNSYPTMRKIIIETEKLYDLKLMTANYRIGNYTIMSFRSRFLNEKYTEKGMNEKSLKFLLDVIFNPSFDGDLRECKDRLAEGIRALDDDKFRYSINKLLSKVEDRPFSYNSYGYLDEIPKITREDLKKYYDSMLKDDIVSVYIVGDVDVDKIKAILREYFKVSTYHKNKIDILVPELANVKKPMEYKEVDDVNQAQYLLLYNLRGLTVRERRYVLPIYSEILGGGANSILFDTVREKNSYAYYVGSMIKPQDNIMIVYSGINKDKKEDVKKLIKKCMNDMNKGKFPIEKLDSAKKAFTTGLESTGDTPVGIISLASSRLLLDSPPVEEKIRDIKTITKEEVMALGKKISLYSTFILEAANGND